jgi:hypothetical protein
MTCEDITRRLLVDRYRAGLCLPRFTPGRWFECDVFERSKAGYFIEYEIKMTRQDFKADQFKRQALSWTQRRERTDPTGSPTKWELLKARVPYGPRRFYFVCPTGVLTLPDVPEWAGLIIMDGRRGRPPFTVYPAVLKEAPKLHNTKADPSIAETIRRSCYYRFHNLYLHRKIEHEETEVKAGS